jgi:hypothetical protein
MHLMYLTTCITVLLKTIPPAEEGLSTLAHVLMSYLSTGPR